MTEQSFLFADMSGFTALTEVHGDEEAVELIEEFFAAVRVLLDEHQAEEVKTIGDAVMMRCADPAQSIELGLKIVHEIGGRPGFPVIRAGINTGPATKRGDDWFGSTVNLAARVASAASGGELLVTQATADAAGDLEGIVLHEHGRAMIRNISEPVRLLRPTRGGASDESGLPIDPVCRMAVDPDDAAGSLRHRGSEYYFCSLNCAQQFAAAPSRFAPAAEE